VGTLTPAGQALVDAGLFTQLQLEQLGAVVVDTIDPALSNQFRNDWLNTFDLKVAVPIKIGEKVSIEPSASIYNLFNVANFNIHPGQRLNGVLDGGVGSLNDQSLTDAAATFDVRNTLFRAVQTPSLYSLGSARQFEFGLRFVW
ncbi:MAG: hypothetical protein ACRD3I_12490, partial [Terriglobales bacterium]